MLIYIYIYIYIYRCVDHYNKPNKVLYRKTFNFHNPKSKSVITPETGPWLLSWPSSSSWLGLVLPPSCPSLPSLPSVAWWRRYVNVIAFCICSWFTVDCQILKTTEVKPRLLHDSAQCSCIFVSNRIRDHEPRPNVDEHGGVDKALLFGITWIDSVVSPPLVEYSKIKLHLMPFVSYQARASVAC